jgi:hypothetical protein
MTTRISIDDLKARFTIPFLWSHFGLPGEPSRNCKSPFRDDRNPSFSVYCDGAKWNDFASGEGGDAIDFVAKVKGCNKGEAIQYLRELSGARHAPAPFKPEAAKAEGPRRPAHSNGMPAPEWLMLPEELSDKEKGIVYCINAVENLRYNTELIKRIAAWKNISEETVCSLAADPSIGWLNDQLCFIYETGLKTRRGLGVPKDEREIRWGWGLPCLWRGFPLMDHYLRTLVRTVHITEGESDCMCLVDAGLETDDLSVICVSLPSASSIPHNLARLCSGKEVLFYPDNDTAGEQASDKLYSILRPVVKSFACLNWEPQAA